MRWITSLLLILITLPSIAQDFRSWQYLDRYYSFQVGTGKAMYFGELKHNYKLQKGLSVVNVAVEARLTKRIAARSELSGFNLNGYDLKAADSTFDRQRNLSFHSLNAELNLMGVYFLKEYNGEYHKRDAFDPYVATGIGVTYLNPKTYQDDQEYTLHQFRTEGVDYSQFTLSVPVVLGVKMKMNAFINLLLEASYRFTFSDYLDDVSANFATSYVDSQTELLANRKDEIGIVNQEAYDLLIPGEKRGNPSNKDQYFFFSLKAEFFLPPGILNGGRGSLLKKSGKL